MNRIDKAVIVAAGFSSRLQPLSLKLPKGLLEVRGETILGRSVRLLQEHEIKQILLIVGYQRELIKKALGSHICYQLNPFFSMTNNMGSLWFAKEWVKQEPFIYLHGDIIYPPEFIQLLLSGNCEDTSLLVDCGKVDDEAMKVRIKEGYFIDSSKDIPLNEAFGEWVGMAIFKYPYLLFNKIENLLCEGIFQAYDTLAITRMAEAGSQISIIKNDGLAWVDIDTELDLIRARKLFL